MPSLDEVKKEYEEIMEQLGDPGLISDWEKMESLSKRKNSLEKIIEKDKETQDIKVKIEENKAILSSNEDPQLATLAQEELVSLKERQKSLEKEMENLLSEEKNDEPRAIIVEIRAGAGGAEAAIFAADLYRMYSKYAQNQGWSQRVLDSRPTELAGFKEIIFEFRDSDVFSKMKNEAGVHRIQRIPETEKAGRIHTSTASVAILPKPKKTDIKVNPQDLRVDFYRSSGPGGQYVNKRETAVRITHLPSGLVVTSQTERNQLQNKENALAILEARLLERKEKEETEKYGEKRRIQIGGAKRSEKIRTYNVPQDRLTDHRLKKSWHDLEKIMNGDLDPIINDLREKK